MGGGWSYGVWWAELVTGVSDGTVRLFFEARRGRGVRSVERTIGRCRHQGRSIHSWSFPTGCPLLRC